MFIATLLLSIVGGLLALAAIRGLIRRPRIDVTVRSDETVWHVGEAWKLRWPLTAEIDEDGTLRSIGESVSKDASTILVASSPDGVFAAYFSYCYHRTRRERGIHFFQAAPVHVHLSVPSALGQRIVQELRGVHWIKELNLSSPTVE